MAEWLRSLTLDLKTNTTDVDSDPIPTLISRFTDIFQRTEISLYNLLYHDQRFHCTTCYIMRFHCTPLPLITHVVITGLKSNSEHQ